MSSRPLPGYNQNRVMLGFVVRKCAMDLGHQPTPEEFADWANNQEEYGRRYSLFGRPISASAAEVMFCQPGRLVAVRSPYWLKATGVR